ncbi:MAG: prepilin-type N-terminal cleavage/methylation domain-containing protein [Geminicoccaceae bacterium]|nr:prepilin-type N-terminal cleavage/methylation domain-containing protein [Geminicoccaceae bacterium]
MSRRGFTLLELLVALAVLALAAAVAAGGLDVLGRALARERRAAEEGRALALAHEQLRLKLARALPLDWGPPQRPLVAFLGEANRVRFVSAPGPYRAEEGLQLVEAALEERAGGRVLTLRRAGLVRDGSGFARLDSVEPVPLAAVGRDSTFAYFGEREGRGARWWPDWPPGPKLPAAVRLDYEGGDAPLVIRLVIDTPLICLAESRRGGVVCE